ncbi:hypothetical protein KKG41_00615 [Patescibacteria group bacterium]|nr:hypothetical protein [Patescibacteria group bacterium]MBU1890712.1 hypothetical protein [Patescibacteria group bacterium]
MSETITLNLEQPVELKELSGSGDQTASEPVTQDPGTYEFVEVPNPFFGAKGSAWLVLAEEGKPKEPRIGDSRFQLLRRPDVSEVKPPASTELVSPPETEAS